MSFDPICVESTHDVLLFIMFRFHLYVSFAVAWNHSAVNFIVGLVDDCYVDDDIWPVCSDVVNLGLRYTVWAFPRPSRLVS